MYVALTAVSAAFGLSSGVIQVRISEALCVLPAYFSSAIPGVTIGCLIANIFFGASALDIAVGTLATLIGAIICWLIRKWPYAASVPTILSNALIIPVVLILQNIGTWNEYFYFAGTVGLGELIACGILGTLIIVWFEQRKKRKNIKEKTESAGEEAKPEISEEPEEKEKEE